MQHWREGKHSAKSLTLSSEAYEDLKMKTNVWWCDDRKIKCLDKESWLEESPNMHVACGEVWFFWGNIVILGILYTKIHEKSKIHGRSREILIIGKPRTFMTQPPSIMTQPPLINKLMLQSREKKEENCVRRFTCNVRLFVVSRECFSMHFGPRSWWCRIE